MTGVSFTADKDKLMVKGNTCIGETCFGSMYYTLDGLKTFNLLLNVVDTCVWEEKENNIYCTKWTDPSQYGDMDSTGLQLVSSTTFFSTQMTYDLGGTVVGLKYVKGFTLAAVKPFYSPGNKLFVSKNGSDFKEARFPGSGDVINGFTVLESSSFSISVDILSKNKSSTLPPFGTLYFSDAEGVLFTPSLEHTNHASNYLVDFETIQSYKYDGILLANTVKNYDEVLSKDSFSEEDKHLVSKLSFDHGKSWNYLRSPEYDFDGNKYSCEGPCYLNLHSVTHPHNMGKVFSTTSSPGVILGVGSVGEYLRPYSQCDTFLSTDAGLTWKAIAKGPHKYETVASGSIIFLVPDGTEPQHYFLYSNDYGFSWQRKELLLNGKKWVPWITILDPDSKYLKALMVAMSPDDMSSGWIVLVDFSKAISRQCNSVDPSTSNDFEIWSPSSGIHNCLLGQSIKYYRRKADAICYIDQSFTLPAPELSLCECSKYDYECDVGFVPSNIGNEFHCVAQKEYPDQPLDCKPGSSYIGKSGYRKVPGNRCVGGLNLLKNVTRECVVNSPNTPNQDAPEATLLLFDSAVDQIFYVANSTIVLIIIRSGMVFKSLKGGSNFFPLTSLNNTSIYKIEASEAIPSRIYFHSEKAILIIDDIAANNEAYSLELPAPPNSLGVPVFDLHHTEKDWYVFASSPSDCNESDLCHTTIYFTKDNGKNWKQIDTWAEKCVWAGDRSFSNVSLELDAIYCLSFIDKTAKKSQEKLRESHGMEDKVNELEFVVFSNDGSNRVVLVERGAVGFYVVSNLLIIASKLGTETGLLVSSDGLQVFKAEFPANALHAENVNFYDFKLIDIYSFIGK